MSVTVRTSDGSRIASAVSARRVDCGRPRGGRPLRRQLLPYLLIAPAACFLGIFVFWPVLEVVYVSFQHWNLVSPDQDFVGLDNYRGLFANPGFVELLLHSLMYVVGALLANFLLPLGLATFTLQLRPKVSRVYQAVLFTPTVVSMTVGGALWQFLYLPTGGVVSTVLSWLHLPTANWLNDPHTAMPAVAVATAWNTLGFSYIICLAALAALPKTVLEAAQVDGVSGWQMLRHLVLPLLTPTLLFLALTSILQALPNSFVPVNILTGGGPNESSNQLLYDVYRTGFRFFDVGSAAAEVVVLMAIFGCAAVWQFRLLDRRANYDQV